MALPAGISTATLTVGVPVNFSGTPLKSYISIEPSVSLVHIATGTPLVNLIDRLDTTEGAAGQFVLPHTDQDGFQDEAGNAYKNWYYTATIQYANNKATLPERTKTFQLATGQSVVDLDLLPSGNPAMPYTAPVAGVTSVNGQTGSVLMDTDYVGTEVVPAATGGNDGPTIQAKIDAAAASGKTVSLPKGVFVIDAPLVLPSGVTIEGVGPDTQIITATGANCAVFINSDTVNGNNKITIRNLFANGNRENQTTAFSTIYLVRVTDSLIENVWARGGKRTAAFPTGNRGEALELIYSDRNRIINFKGFETDYDAVKLRTSHRNIIDGVIADECGKGAVQLAYAQELSELDYSAGSMYNTVSNVTVRHSTGTPPNGFSPQTNGITLHCASHNVINNLSVYGTMVGIATAGSDASVLGNLVRGVVIQTRAIQTPLALGIGSYNLFDAIHVKLISGTGGYFVELNGSRNTISNSQFNRGDATGNWTDKIHAGGFENALLWNMHDDTPTWGGYDDLGGRTIIMERGRQGSIGLGMEQNFGGGVRIVGIGNALTVPSSSSVDGTLFYSEGNGTLSALKARTSNGTLNTLAGSYVLITSNYTVVGTDRYIIANGGNISIGSPEKGRVVTIKNINAATCTITGVSSLIDGAPSITLSQWASVDLIGTATNWLIVSRDLASVLTSANGTRFRVSVDDDGALTTTSL